MLNISIESLELEFGDVCFTYEMPDEQYQWCIDNNVYYCENRDSIVMPIPQN